MGSTPQTPYINIFVRNMPEPVYCYRSGLTVYEERFLNGVLVPGGWNGAGIPSTPLPTVRPSWT